MCAGCSSRVFFQRIAQPAAAGLLIAMVEGYGSLAKNAREPEVMKAGIKNIATWLQSLRAGQPQETLIASL
jgi:hypothetical protein